MENMTPSPILNGRKLPLDPAAYRILPLSDQLRIILQSHGKEKLNLIMNSRKPEIVVPRLHPQELFLTINELGAEDSLDLIALASPEQITLIFDLDCWDQDSLSEETSLRWLEFLLHCGEDKIRQLARELDPDILALMLKKHLTITRGIEAYDDDDAENANRLESIYDITYHSEDAMKTIGALIRVWQELEQAHFLQIMELLRSEQMTTLEEEVFQNRNVRLLDYGILPQHQAKAIYSHVDPATFTTGDKTGFGLEAESLPNPQALLSGASPPDLLAAVLERGLSHETACELLHLVNRKLSADRVDASSTVALKESLQNIYDTLNLALDYLSNNDDGAARTIIDTTYLMKLFQLGHSLVADGCKKIGALHKHRLCPYLDEQENLFIDAALQTPPQLYLPGNDAQPPVCESVTRMAQLRRMTQTSEAIASMLALFDTLFPGQPDEDTAELWERAGLSGVLMTAVANQLINGEFKPEPLASQSLAMLKDATITGTSIDPSFEKQLLQLLPANPDFAHYCLHRWQTLLSDPEFFKDPVTQRNFMIMQNQ